MFNFTKQEQKAIIFISSLLLLGLFLRQFIKPSYKTLINKFQKENKQTKIDFKLDINQAKFEDLIKLPGIGESIANRIISYRDENGGFNSLEELTNVKGIAEKKIKQIEKFIYKVE